MAARVAYRPREGAPQYVDEATDTFLMVATDPALKGKGGELYGEMRVVDSSPESFDAEKPGACGR